MLDHAEILRLYGPWHSRVPADVAALMTGYGGRWWLAGGWAIEAFTGQHRHHNDLDLGIPRADVTLLQEHLTGRLDIWAAEQGALRPLIEPCRHPLPTTCGNLWLRRSGTDPWEYDVLLMDLAGPQWQYKRDPRIVRPLDDILWSQDGISVLRPEVQLLHKARDLRPQDQEDFHACLPLLDGNAESWLAEALRVAHPGHPWLELLRLD